MVRHKSKYPDAQPPKNIGSGNFEEAVDQIGAYESLAYSLAAYRVNVGDTIVEYYGKGNVRALHEGLRSFDRQVKKLWKELRVAVKKVGGGTRVTEAGSVLGSLVESEIVDYYDKQLTSSGPDHGRYTEIETEDNPRRSCRELNRKKRLSKKNLKRATNVRSLVSRALK